MTIADDVCALCADAPDAVDLINSVGEVSRGPRDHVEEDVLDERGLSKTLTRTSLLIPTTHLPASVAETTLTAFEADGTRTSYTVRDRRRMEDGQLTRLVVVPT